MGTASVLGRLRCNSRTLKLRLIGRSNLNYRTSSALYAKEGYSFLRRLWTTVTKLVWYGGWFIAGVMLSSVAWRIGPDVAESIASLF